MMTDPQLSEEDIFQVARRIDSADERSAYLDQTCGENLALREQVEALLAAHDASDRFLESPATGILGNIPSLDQPLAEQPGTQIGPYKLLEQIGEGGMGVVYLAEQTEPVQRRVALKIIKAGMDTRQVIGRFEAERQALAIMDHPNISKVLDAGTTDSGQPYFVMELVKGVPITVYCDEHHLTPRERLELFLPVCQAVQHAHQKGIIHRDIKPSNVMVAHYDDRPVPKIIDFGVAKAVDQQLTEETVFTQFGQIVGTMEYMSPEQARLNQLDVDTRSDIYSLGVLLYELLTGETPFDGERLRSAAFDEVLQIIREEEPPRPSSRLSTSGSLPETASNRQVEPKQLCTLVRGELDWIVMKALEKNRARRYETANSFANDIQRYLDDQPVNARPPSNIYMIGKFTRRNKGWLFTVAAVLLTAFVGLTISTILIAQERDAAEESAQREAASARREAVAAEEADRQRQSAEENLRESRAAVDRLFIGAATELEDAPHMSEVRSALLKGAAEFYEQFVKQKTNDPAIREERAQTYKRLGWVYHSLGRLSEAVAASRLAIVGYEELCFDFPDRFEFKGKLSECYYDMAVFLSAANYQGAPETRPYIAKALELAEELAKQRPNDSRIRYRYVQHHNQLLKLAPRRNPENEPHARKAILLWEQLRADFPDLKGLDAYEAMGRESIATYFAGIGQFEEAESQYRYSIKLSTEAIEEFPHSVRIKLAYAWVENNYSDLLLDRRRLVEAEEHYLLSIELLEPLVQGFPNRAMYIHPMLRSYDGLSQVLISLGRLGEAEQVLVRSIHLPRQFQENRWDPVYFARLYYRLGLVYHRQGQVVQAADMFREAFAIFEQVLSKEPANSPFEQHTTSDLRSWFVTCPLPQFHDAGRTIVFSKKLLQQNPESADGWNSLGIGHYRAGDFDNAIEALEKSVQFGDGGTNRDFYFLAMTHWRRGEQGKAHQWYQRGVGKETNAAGTFDLDVLNFRREAEKVLDIMEETEDDSSPPEEETEPADAKSADGGDTNEQTPEDNN